MATYDETKTSLLHTLNTYIANNNWFYKRLWNAITSRSLDPLFNHQVNQIEALRDQLMNRTTSLKDVMDGILYDTSQRRWIGTRNDEAFFAGGIHYTNDAPPFYMNMSIRLFNHAATELVRSLWRIVSNYTPASANDAGLSQLLVLSIGHRAPIDAITSLIDQHVNKPNMLNINILATALNEYALGRTYLIKQQNEVTMWDDPMDRMAGGIVNTQETCSIINLDAIDTILARIQHLPAVTRLEILSPANNALKAKSVNDRGGSRSDAIKMAWTKAWNEANTVTIPAEYTQSISGLERLKKLSPDLLAKVYPGTTVDAFRTATPSSWFYALANACFAPFIGAFVDTADDPKQFAFLTTSNLTQSMFNCVFEPLTPSMKIAVMAHCLNVTLPPNVGSSSSSETYADRLFDSGLHSALYTNPNAGMFRAYPDLCKDLELTAETIFANEDHFGKWMTHHKPQLDIPQDMAISKLVNATDKAVIKYLFSTTTQSQSNLLLNILKHSQTSANTAEEVLDALEKLDTVDQKQFLEQKNVLGDSAINTSVNKPWFARVMTIAQCVGASVTFAQVDSPAEASKSRERAPGR